MSRSAHARAARDTGDVLLGILRPRAAAGARVASGDTVHVETLTHQAGDAPDLMMDDGVRAVYEGIPAAQRGPGVHVMTGPIAVEGARAGDTLEVRILSMRPRLPYGTNIGAWWGYLYGDMKKERITIYEVDTASGYGHAPRSRTTTSTRRSTTRRGPSCRPSAPKRQPALSGVLVPLRPHFGVMGVAPREGGKVNSIPPGDFGGNVDNWRVGPGATMYYPVQNDGALFFIGDPHAAEGDAELSGTAIESSHDGVIQLTVRQRSSDRLPHPRDGDALVHARLRRGSRRGDAPGRAAHGRVPRRALRPLSRRRATHSSASRATSASRRSSTSAWACMPARRRPPSRREEIASPRVGGNGPSRYSERRADCRSA